MSSVYYYFAASLPMLGFGNKPPISTEYFLGECQRLLSPQDYQDIVCALNFDEENAHNATLKDCHKFERYLRNELVALRARQFNRDPQPHLHGERGIDVSVMDALNQVAKSPDPLTTQKILDQARWQRLGELGTGHYFDLEFLVIYAMKLKILSRHEQIKSDKGVKSFEEYRESFINKKIVYT